MGSLNIVIISFTPHRIRGTCHYMKNLLYFLALHALCFCLPVCFVLCFFMFSFALDRSSLFGNRGVWGELKMFKTGRFQRETGVFDCSNTVHNLSITCSKLFFGALLNNFCIFMHIYACFLHIYAHSYRL